MRSKALAFWGTLFFLSLFSALFSAPASATSFYSRPFPKTVQDSPVIIRAHIGNSYSDWGAGPDGVRRIYTLYNVEVQEVFKGEVGASTLVMREMGGEKDGIGMQVAGASRFEPGENVVVLLSPKNPDGSFDVRGLMMGKFDILKDDAGEEYLKGPALEPEVHTEHDASGQLEAHGAQKWTLRDLRKLVATQSGMALASSRPMGAVPPARISPASPNARSSDSSPPSLSSEEARSRDSAAFQLAIIGVVIFFAGLAFYVFMKMQGRSPKT